MLKGENRMVIGKISLMGLIAMGFIAFGSQSYALDEHEGLDARPETELSPADKEKRKEQQNAVAHGAHTTVDNAAAKLGKVISFKSPGLDARFSNDTTIGKEFKDATLYPFNDPKYNDELVSRLRKVTADPLKRTRLSEIEIAIRNHPEVNGKNLQLFMYTAARLVGSLSDNQITDLDSTLLVNAVAGYSKSTAGQTEDMILDRMAVYAEGHQSDPINEIVKGGIHAYFEANGIVDPKKEKDIEGCILLGKAA